ncbi:MAG: hypothetical protein U5R49_01955 [Deltaproteobacteria bacterium]|nr:hypothetical protein [Deltaproteobacteria bacterium]
MDSLIAFRKLIDPGIIPPSIKKKVARLRPSSGSFYAFIGTRIDPASAGLTDANIIHFEYTDVNRVFASIAGRQESDPFPYYFVTSPSLKDPDHRHAPDGCHTLEVISGLGYEHPFTPWSGTQSRGRGGDYLRLKNRIGMSLVRSAERYIPGLSSELDYVEFATPLSNEYWVNSFGGEFRARTDPGPIRPRTFLRLHDRHRRTFCGGSRRHLRGRVELHGLRRLGRRQGRRVSRLTMRPRYHDSCHSLI